MARKTKQRRKSAARPAAAAGPGTRDDDAVIDAALRLAEAKGWGRTSFADIAEEVGLSLSELYARFRSKRAILEAFVQRIDRATLDGAEAAKDGDQVRDRLFELFMRRFDALQPHKPAVAALMRELMRHPLAVLCSGRRLCRSMAWIASVAGLPTGDLLGPLRLKALSAIYLYTLRTWLADDTDDHAKTMAVLDKALSRAEMFANSVPRPARRSA